jgi:hypothetical protein
MNGETESKASVRAAFLVAAATLLAFLLPAMAPLYAQVYPGSDPKNVAEALDKANVDAGFESDRLMQFEEVAFKATVIYGTATTPKLPTVLVSWNNEAILTAQQPEAFVIDPTSPSRQFLELGTPRPGGGFELT